MKISLQGLPIKINVLPLNSKKVLFIQGELGTQKLIMDHIDYDNNSIIVSDLRSYQLIKKMIQGVTKGFKLKIKLVGVGYRATINNNNLELHIGYKDPVIKTIKPGIELKIRANETLIEGWSINYNDLTHYLSEIIQIKPSYKDKYSGKGIMWA